MKTTDQTSWKELLDEIRFRLKGGPERIVRWVGDRLEDESADRDFGIVTSQRRTAKELGINSGECSNYQAISYDDLRYLFSRLSLKAEDSLVDYGSGMGRVVCVAATYPINKVIGVELSSELCSIARENLQRIQSRTQCRHASIFEGDATSFRIEPDITVFYFFNPFTGSILQRVLHCIEQSIRNHPRPARLVFCGTVSTAMFLKVAVNYTWLVPSSSFRLPTGVMALLYDCQLPG